MTRQRLSDKRMICELEAGQEWLLSAPASRRLLSLIRSRLQSITRNVYIVRHITEQTEDLYDILVDGSMVVQIEVPRDVSGAEILFEKSDVKEYLGSHRQLTKPDRRKLELAIELAQR
ncbi:hypothetical protein [Bradyrhizobium canariense]|nr:hypothetical protein [Bradyrhizobium canariense]